MKINVSFPATGCQKLFEVDDEKKLRSFYEKRMGHEVEADHLGDEWKGYVLRIAGGNDKQGFPMKQGVLTNNRVRLLLSKGQSCYRPRRTGERKRKSVRGCIVDSNLSVLALVVIKKGQSEIPGLTDKVVPRKLGPKRASKVRKLFCLEKKDDVRRYVIKRPLTGKEGKKPKSQAPKIQRLITPSVLLHRRHKNAVKRLRREKNKELKGDYAKLLATRQKEAREKKREEIRRRRSSMRESKSSAASAPTEEKRVKLPTKKVVAVKGVKKPIKGGKAAAPVKLTIKQAGGATAKAAAATAKATTKTSTKPAPKQGVKQLTKEKSKLSKAATGKSVPQKAPAKEKPVAKATATKPTAAKPTTKPSASKPAPAKSVPSKPTAAKSATAKPAAPKSTTPKATPVPKATPAPPKPAAPKKAAAPKPASGTAKPSGGAKPKPAKPQKK